MVLRDDDARFQSAGAAKELAHNKGNFSATA